MAVVDHQPFCEIVLPLVGITRVRVREVHDLGIVVALVVSYGVLLVVSTL